MEIAATYFRKLFTTSDEGDDSNIFNTIQHQISDEINDKLLQEFSKEEVSRAVKELGPLKAPGLDGFLAIIYHKY